MIQIIEFSRLITTKKGQALNAKMIAGTGPVRFTKVCTSDAAYAMNELENLHTLEGIRQTGIPTKIARTNEVGVKIETVFSNFDLKTGYYIRTLGLFANDPDEEEILYAAAVSVSDQGYMPAYNGITSTAAYINLIYAVGNAHNVSLNVDPGCFATIGDLLEIEKRLGVMEAKIDWLVHNLCGYYPDRAQKKIVSLLPHEVKDGILAFPEGMAYVEGDKVVLQGAGAGAFPSFPGSSFPGSLPGGTTSGAGSVEEVAAAAAKIVQGSLQEISQGQVMELFRSQDGENTGGETGDHPPQTGQTDSRSDR